MATSFVATIGTFDGVHRGHLALLEQMTRVGERLGLSPAVITFEPTPVEVLRPDLPISLLSSPPERVERLRSLGYEQIILLPFTDKLAALTAEQFMALLRDKYGVRALVLGYDHRFGRDGLGTTSQYEAIGKRLGVHVERAEAYHEAGQAISSSRIRALLLGGDLAEANDLLGYAYPLSGRVVGGLQIGRSLGYPTANLALDDPHKLVPADGVYAVRIRLEPRLGIEGSVATYHTGMLYIGNRPTLEAGLARTIEVNIFDLSANLYAQRMRLELVHYIRGNERFESLEALQAQIARDEVMIRTLLQA